MKFEECIKNVSTFLDLKRIATPYVIDYRKLNEDALKNAMQITAPQYYHPENVEKSIKSVTLNPAQNIRVIADAIIRILLDKDDFTETQSAVEESVISYEQNIVNIANESDAANYSESETLLKFVLEAAWEQNDSVSVDEINLLEKIRVKLKITSQEYQILEAKIGKYPSNSNVIHNRTDIGDARKYLQSIGILFPIRDSNGTDYDVIPEEIALVIRTLYGVEIKTSAYLQLLSSKYVKNKTYMQGILNKANIAFAPQMTIPQLQSLLQRYIRPSNLLGGFSPRDGLDTATLSDWCNSLGVQSYGTKLDLIWNILRYYDSIKQINTTSEDIRGSYFEVFEELANRDLAFLRKQNIIVKDLECEHKFEEATNYIFEKILKNKPLLLKGTDHPDGILSYNDKLIMWDNKSKESPVNLADHIKQFDRYIHASEKPVSVFIVIGPDFTADSAKECLKYSLTNDTLILLITAKELKELAIEWRKKHANDEESFPLGYFKQNGRYNVSNINL